MKRNVFAFILFIFLSACGLTMLSSCHKSTYPSDPYRGTTANPYFYRNNQHMKSKAHRPYRTVRVKGY